MKKWMTRMMSLLLAVIMLLTLCACGTTPEEPTEETYIPEEIEVTAEAVGDTVTVNARFLYPADAPYAFISELSLRNVTLTDSSGDKLMTVAETEIAPINNGSVSVSIPMGTVSLSPDVEYTLTFDTAVGHEKADQPLPMSGNWSCTVNVSE